MNCHYLSISLAAVLALSSCQSNQEENNNPSGTTDPVETEQPNTSYSPAFQGQTRIAGVQTTSSFESRILTQTLRSPWGITGLPSGHLLVTEKGGSMRIVTVEGAVGEPITGIPAVNSAGQGGLLGLRLDPDFASNRTIYWVFSEAITGGNVTSVAKGQLSANEKQIENAQVIYRALPAYAGNLHYGGRILFDQTGNLLVSTGERSDLATRPQAQSLSSGLGKIVRITKNGQAASGNPSVGQSGGRPEIYSYGHRNPQGLAIHPVTGELWESEHGPRGGDEINRIQAGANYGWPTITYGIEYSGQTIGAGIQQQQGMQQPVYYWDPVVSPSGMTFYTGNRIPEWQNNLFISSLSGQHLIRLVIENNQVVGEERLLANEGQRFRDITQGSDGALYAITDGGRLYRIDRN
ncbi:PQQ-dependent sugar dehydrogenase [Siphonobacter sp. SORGH_AS_0500]|uniref:PQQ-dependent sugar dehydrogenase n=1 Tax=Siphonobacter sp. SORGH_AS_0500 TaxID=1864824 RepID=UPI0028626F3D|nr:PQQ-dependent sugar dehydrogenase [Siphonobacter sp. SORGH_AS_0500]MDR6197586.1 glucose/arabinose dehydrogenase [Siphonobacter sp. SORGH_AS_0500]